MHKEGIGKSKKYKLFGPNVAEKTCLFVYSRVRNKRSPTIIKFLTFFQGLRPYSGLHSMYKVKKGATLILFAKFYRGLCLFKGLRLFQTLEYSL